MDQAKLIDDAKEALKITSDYALAKHWGLQPQHISRYRNGTNRFDDYAICRIAEALDKDPRELLAQRELSKEPSGERRSYWETLLKKLCGVSSVGACTAILIGLPLPVPAHGTPETIDCTTEDAAAIAGRHSALSELSIMRR